MKFTAIIFTLILAFCLVSCGTLTPASAAERFLDACADYDEARMLEICPTMPLDGSDAPLFARMHFTFGEPTMLADDAAEVFVTLTVPDVPKLYAAALGESVQTMLTGGGGSLSETVAALAAAEDAPMRIVSLKLPLEKAGIGWAVSDAAPLIEALWGAAAALRRTA